jgi:hypothetical protein
LIAALAPDRTERVPVGPMPLASLHRLFDLRLGRSFPRLALVRIEAESGGNPMYALEIARAISAADIQLDPHTPLPIPDSLSALVAGRVAALPAGTQRVLLFAAAAPEPSLETLESVLRDSVLPALRDLGERWQRGQITIAQEHFASNLLRGRMLGLARGWDRGSGPRALLACPAGEQHDISLIAFGLALREHGWRITYIGTDTPVATTAETARALRPDLVVMAADGKVLAAAREVFARDGFHGATLMLDGGYSAK